MTENQKRILLELLECKPGKGSLLNNGDDRIYVAPLIKDGLVWSLGSCGFKIYMLTEKGRERAAELR